MEHIDYCADLLVSISKINEEAEEISEINEEPEQISERNKEAEEIRKVLKVAATSHMSVRRWEKQTMYLKKLTMDSNTSTVEDLGGALLYLFEGIIPLVTAFCMEFQKLSCSGPAHKTFERLLKGEDIVKTLCSFAQAVRVCFLP